MRSVLLSLVLLTSVASTANAQCGNAVGNGAVRSATRNVVRIVFRPFARLRGSVRGVRGLGCG